MKESQKIEDEVSLELQVDLKKCWMRLVGVHNLWEDKWCYIKAEIIHVVIDSTHDRVPTADDVFANANWLYSEGCNDISFVEPAFRRAEHSFDNYNELFIFLLKHEGTKFIVRDDPEYGLFYADTQVPYVFARDIPSGYTELCDFDEYVLNKIIVAEEVD